MSAKWTPDSWRGKPIRQAPTYPDPAALDRVTTTLKSYPPLVFAGEARALKADLAEVASGTAVEVNAAVQAAKDAAKFRILMGLSPIG